MNSQIPTAVVGLGRAGWSIHVNQIRNRKDLKIVDVTDPDLQRREEAKKELSCGACENLDQLLKSTKAQVIVIATPSFMHEEDAIKVLESGRDCVLEKPMAMSFEGAKKIVAVAQKMKRRLFIHQQHRFGKLYNHLREVIDSGIIGKVFEIKTFWGGFARRNDWQTLRKNGGGILNNTGPHVLDMVLALMDAPVNSLLGDLQHIKDSGDCEDHVHLLMKAKNDRVADVTITSVYALPVPLWTLLGACGSATSDGKTTQLKYYDPKAVPPLPVLDGPAAGRKYGNGEILPWKEEVRPSQATGKYESFYDNVADVLLNGAPMYVTPESVAEVLRIMDWAREGSCFSSMTKETKPNPKSQLVSA
jgi:scyllo-inositol 2-dehydrogenase (NADP+)